MDQKSLQFLWDRLLSAKPEVVTAAFAELTSDEQQSILAHLKRMATEPDWLPAQRLSAQAALDAIQNPGDRP